MKIKAGNGVGIMGIVTRVKDGKAMVVNLMKGTFIKTLEELEPIQTTHTQPKKKGQLQHENNSYS